MIEPLRPPQVELIEAARAAIRTGKRRILLVSPTGSGKTRIAAEIIKLADGKQNRSLFIAPRRELIYQSSATLERHGVLPGIIMAGEPRNEWAKHQVASFDTLYHRGVRREIIPMPVASLLIVDEAHLSLAPTREQIIRQYADKNTLIIGLTATPVRGDGRGLGHLYDDMVIGWSVGRLMEAGFLVPKIRYFAGRTPDLSKVEVKQGDYVVSQLEEALDNGEIIGDVFNNWARHARDRQTVVFCASRKHARHVCQIFVQAGVRAEYVDGETPPEERKGILQRMNTKETQVLVNVFVASYGLDVPSLECCVLARPTKSLGLYIQMGGRVLRALPGKTEALIIDHAAAVEEHGFLEDDIPWSLDPNSRIQDRKKAHQQEKNEPKQIACSKCGTVFKLRRDCPSCGFAMVPLSEPIPTHQADLKEVTREESEGSAAQKKRNRTDDISTKIAFMGELKRYARDRGKKEGWIGHTYRDMYGVWPNDARIRNAPLASHVSESTRNYITAKNIRYAKQQAAGR